MMKNDKHGERGKGGRGGEGGDGSRGREEVKSEGRKGDIEGGGEKAAGF